MKSAGKPGNGSPKPDGARLQAVRLSLEISIIAVFKIAFRQLKAKADVLVLTEGSNPHCVRANDWGNRRGLSTGHAIKGVTWELGRSELSPCTTRLGGYRLQNPWLWERELELLRESERNYE